VKCNWACFLIVLTATAAGVSAAPHIIFDEDWIPRATEVPPRPAVASRPVVAAPATSPAMVPAARLPIPSKGEQASVRKALRESLAKQLVDRTVAGRRKLAESLLKRAEKATGVPVEKFVILAGAIDAATEASDLQMVTIAADRMGRAYEVGGLAIKADAALRIIAKADTAAPVVENVNAVIELAGELAEVDDYVTAVRLCTMVLPLTGKHPALRTQVQQFQHDLAIARDAAERYFRDLAKLKVVPNDPAANLSAGRYLCFVRGEWETGLVMLSKGSDVLLVSLAAQELVGPTAVDAVVHLADGWWEHAAKETDPINHAGVAGHAATLYRRVMGGTNGLRRALIEKRLAEFAAAPLPTGVHLSLAKLSRPIELLAGMETKGTRDEQGIVTLKGSQRVSTNESFKTPVAFRIVAQTDSTNIRIAYAADQIIFNWEGRPTELRIDGGPANRKYKAGAGEIPKNTWVTIDLVVKPDSMTISVDGEERHLIEADFSKIDQKLEIFSAGSKVMVKSVLMSRLPG